MTTPPERPELQPDDFATARYARMRWNTPLSEDHAALLLDRLGLRPESSILDVGCGWGGLLLRAVEASSAGTGRYARGTGIDTDAAALDRARSLASQRGLAGAVSFVDSSADVWREPADRLICVGSTHAFGGIAQVLSGLAQLTGPGGRLLFGDGCWEQAGTDRAAALFPEVATLEDVLAHASAAGWRVLHLSTADQREWDDFESTWRAGRTEWLLANQSDPRAAEVRQTLDRQLAEYVGGYRGVLGFCYLVLAR